MKFLDVLLLAFRTVRSNKLRTGLTVAIIALGIFALILIVTAIGAIEQKFTESFSTMGANGFTLRFKERNIRIGGGNNNRKRVQLTKKGNRKEKASNLDKRITKDEAEVFLNSYKFPSTKSISIWGNNNNIISYETKKTTPTVFMFGADENYLLLNGYNLLYGRNVNQVDVRSGRNVCIVGYDIATKLFKENPSGAVNAVIRINSIPYRVLGVLESKGSTFGFSRDNLVITTYNNIERSFPTSASYIVAVMTADVKQVDNAMGEAEGVFRGIRKLTTLEENNFVLDRSDSIARTIISILGFLLISVMVIGIITLIGSAIGLMNIMLVSVSERTREVGLIKAIGGKSKMVRRQFLLESVIISLMGAFWGIILGIAAGNLIALSLNTGFIIPWNWVLIGIGLCTIVGLLAGLYPALKAGRLNPIEALRYE
jgi:putative ABC transport system permease protein